MIIALSGPMGSGKSTAVEILKFMLRDANTHKKVKVIKFAQPLYDMQEMVYRRVSSVYTRPEDFIKDRKLLQYLGTDWGRGTIGESIWVDLWDMEVQKAVQEGYIVVCDDCRFDNEAEAVKGAGGIVIKIESAASLARAQSPNGIKNHASEQGIDVKLADIVVNNDTTLDQFDWNMRTVFNKILAPISAQKLG